MPERDAVIPAFLGRPLAVQETEAEVLIPDRHAVLITEDTAPSCEGT